MKAFTKISPNGHSAMDFLVHVVAGSESVVVISVVEMLLVNIVPLTSIRSDQEIFMAVVFLESSPFSDDFDHLHPSAAAVYVASTTPFNNLISRIDDDISFAAIRVAIVNETFPHQSMRL